MKSAKPIVIAAASALLATSTSGAWAGPKPQAAELEKRETKQVDKLDAKEAAIKTPAVVNPPGDRYRRTHFRKGPQIESAAFVPDFITYAEGIVERVEDGMVFFSFPMSEDMRAEAAKRRNLPLSEIPLKIERGARLWPGGPDEASVMRRVGQQVRFELKQDPNGFLFVTDLLSSKLTPAK